MHVNFINVVNSIWIVCSTFIERAEQFVKSSQEIARDLSSPDVKVLLREIPGLGFVKLYDVMSHLSSTKLYPRFLVIHVGSNDIPMITHLDDKKC